MYNKTAKFPQSSEVYLFVFPLVIIIIATEHKPIPMFIITIFRLRNYKWLPQRLRQRFPIFFFFRLVLIIWKGRDGEDSVPIRCNSVHTNNLKHATVLQLKWLVKRCFDCHDFIYITNNRRGWIVQTNVHHSSQSMEQNGRHATEWKQMLVHKCYLQLNNQFKCSLLVR